MPGFTMGSHKAKAIMKRRGDVQHGLWRGRGVWGNKANKVNQTEKNTSNGGSWQKLCSASTVETIRQGLYYKSNTLSFKHLTFPQFMIGHWTLILTCTKPKCFHYIWSSTTFEAKPIGQLLLTALKILKSLISSYDH